MRRFLYILALVSIVGVVRAAPSMKLSIDRDRIYLGESVIASVSVEGSRSDTDRPVFENIGDGDLEFLGSRDNSHSSITIVNGKMTRESFEGRVFVYRITPSEAGVLETGRVSLRSKGQVVSAPGARIVVTGIEKRDDIFAAIDCADTTVLVDSAFTIRMSISIRALPAPYSDVEPIMPGKPLHIEAEFLNGAEVKGLKLPDLENILNPLVSRRREPTFTINQYASRGMSMNIFDFGDDPFAARPINFRLPPKKAKRGDNDYWDYSIVLDYVPTAEGDYTFGPLTVKGSFISGVGNDDTAIMSEIFVVGPAVTVRVVPPPEEGRPDWFIGSVGKSMKATAAFDTSYCKVGDPLTLSLDLVGEISQSNLKPPLLSLQPESSDDFRIYDDNIESDSIEGGKRFKYRVRPLRAGTLEFPAIYTAYFNTTNGTYVTVATPPMPVQAEATTQIAAVTSDGEDVAEADEASAVAAIWTPDGIMAASSDPAPSSLRIFRRFCGNGGALGVALPLLLAPASWGIVSLLMALARRIAAGRRRNGLKIRARENVRTLGKAASLAEDDPAAAAAMAAGAARVAVAARLGIDTSSMTESEMRRELERRSVPQETTDGICASFAMLERISYARGDVDGKEVSGVISRLGREIARMSSALKTLLVAAVLCTASAKSALAGHPPADFEWERANLAMAAASSQEDFVNAARMYYSMVTNGASSGPLYYNLATALLLADGGKAAALEALVAAESHLGTTAEIARDMRLALSSESGRGQLPVSRIFLIWHYGLSYATRIDIAVFAYLTLWFALVIAALCGHRVPTLRKFLRAVALLSLVLAALYGGSAFVSFMQQRQTDMPHVAGFLSRDGGGQ